MGLTRNTSRVYALVLGNLAVWSAEKGGCGCLGRLKNPGDDGAEDVLAQA